MVYHGVVEREDGPWGLLGRLRDADPLVHRISSLFTLAAATGCLPGHRVVRAIVSCRAARGRKPEFALACVESTRQAQFWFLGHYWLLAGAFTGHFVPAAKSGSPGKKVAEAATIVAGEPCGGSKLAALLSVHHSREAIMKETDYPHEEPHAGTALDAADARDVTGPTARQELLLKRQHLWTKGLTQQQASELIEEFLTRKHAERRLRQQTGGRTVNDNTPSE